MAEALNHPAARHHLHSLVSGYHQQIKDGGLYDAYETVDDVENLIDSMTPGRIFPDSFYQKGLWGEIRGSGNSVRLKLFPRIGDTVMNLPVIYFMADALRSEFGTGNFQVDVSAKYHSILRGINLDGVTVSPAAAREPLPSLPTIALDASPYRESGDYDINWLLSRHFLPMRLNNGQFQRSGPEMLLRAMELTLGIKLPEGLNKYSLPLPELKDYESDELRKINNGIGLPYFMVSNAASVGPKRWPHFQFMEIVRLIKQYFPGNDIVYCADPYKSDKDTQRALALFPDAGVKLFSTTSLPVFMHVASGAQAGLFCDTGLGHLSSRFVPTLMGFSFASPSFWSMKDGREVRLATKHAKALEYEGYAVDETVWNLNVQSSSFPVDDGEGVYESGQFELLPETVSRQFIDMVMSNK